MHLRRGQIITLVWITNLSIIDFLFHGPLLTLTQNASISTVIINHTPREIVEKKVPVNPGLPPPPPTGHFVLSPPPIMQVAVNTVKQPLWGRRGDNTNKYSATSWKSVSLVHNNPLKTKSLLSTLLLIQSTYITYVLSIHIPGNQCRLVIHLLEVSTALWVTVMDSKPNETRYSVWACPIINIKKTGFYLGCLRGWGGGGGGGG